MRYSGAPLSLLVTAALLIAACSTKYAIPAASSGNFEYRLEASSGGAGRNTAPTLTCWRRLVPSGDSALEYHRRLSAAGWIGAIGGSVLLCGSGAWGWSQGWTGLGQYSLGLGIALPIAAPLLAHSHGRTRAPKRLTSFHPAVGESLAVENLSASRSCTYVTGASGRVALAADDIKDWLAGLNDVSLWVTPREEHGSRIGINITSTGIVRQVGIEDMTFDAAESAGTVKAFAEFLREFPASGRATQAMRAIELLAWKAACAENTRKSYQDFLRTYPQSESVAAVPYRIERAVLDSAEAEARAERARREQGEAAEKARREREEAAERAREEAKYTPLSPFAAIQQWVRFRSDEAANVGTVTTWRFKVSYVYMNGDFMGYLGDYLSHPVYVGPGSASSVHIDDWVAVTGEFVFVSTTGAVALRAIRVQNEGYRGW
jgi:hypothetical protein